MGPSAGDGERPLVARGGSGSRLAVRRREVSGTHSFTYTALSEDGYCSGDLDLMLSGSRSRNGCTSWLPLDAEVEGPGEVAIGTGSTTGWCDAADIWDTLQAHRGALEACYDLSLRQDADLVGATPHTWTIGPKAVLVQPTASELLVNTCTRDVLRRLPWKRPDTGVCQVQWTFGYHLEGTPAPEVGHGHEPASASCPAPEAPSGVPSLGLDELTAVGGSWTLSGVELYGSLQPDDGVVQVYGFVPGSLQEARKRAVPLCHNQPVKFAMNNVLDAFGHPRPVWGPRTDLDADKVWATLPVRLDLDHGQHSDTRDFSVHFFNGDFKWNIVDRPARQAAQPLAQLIRTGSVWHLSASGELGLHFEHVDQDGEKVVVQVTYRRGTEVVATK